jgi:hypothetical protein
MTPSMQGSRRSKPVEKTGTTDMQQGEAHVPISPYLNRHLHVVDCLWCTIGWLAALLTVDWSGSR